MSGNSSGSIESSALRALLASHVGVAGGVHMPGIDPSITPDDSALDPADNATPEMKNLCTQQVKALSNILGGRSYTAAADAAGVTRRTLHRWISQDTAFRAALEAWRRWGIQVAEDRLTIGVDDAAKVLTDAASRDYRAAAILLKGRGLLPGAPRPSKVKDTTPVETFIPPQKRMDFEVRLRELILSFREQKETPPAPPPAPQIEMAGPSAAPETVAAGEGNPSVISPDDGPTAAEQT